MGNEQLLISKLDEFIRKYYKNRIFKGLLLVTSLLASMFLITVGLEFLFVFGKTVRFILFFLNIGIACVFVVVLVLIPLLQVLRIGKIISHEKAAEIIGSHFTDISDKLLNTLQLMQAKQQTTENLELLLAGIDQKISSLKILRFPKAVNLKRNFRYLRFALPPLLLISGLALMAPSFISGPAKRIIHYQEELLPDLPFTVEILNENLKAMQQEDFLLKVKFSGEAIPSESFVRIENVNYRMKKEKSFLFSFEWRSLQSDIRFKIVSGSYTSGEYILKVYPKPVLLNFDAMLNYPSYTGKHDELIENSGDLVVPEGTRVTWNIFTRDVNSVRMRFPSGTEQLSRGEKNNFTFSGIAKESLSYSITPFNEYVYKPDSLVYRMTVIKDAYPSIEVSSSFDTSLLTSVFFKCTVRDDYGFTKLVFIVEQKANPDSVFEQETVEIPVSKGVSQQALFFTWDMGKIMDRPGAGVVYYFEIWDNDGIHGPKSTRSERQSIKVPSLEDLETNTGNNAKEIRTEIEKSLKQSKDIKKNIEDLNRKMVEQKSMSWQEKNQINEIIKANENITEKVREIKLKNEENIRNEEKYLNTSERIVEKQKKLNELMDQMLTDEMKRMMEELKTMLNEVDKKKLGEVLEKMKLTNEDLEKQLDRNLEIYNQLEFDRKLEKTVDELRKTADDLDKLAGKTLEKEGSQEQLSEQQDAINDRFDTVQQQLKELEKDAMSLSVPMDLEKTKENRNKIDEDLKNGGENLRKKSNSAASKSQKDAAKGMKDLAQSLEDMQESAEDEQLEVDVANLRMILENLVRLSFEQEDLIYKTNTTNRMDPKYLELIGRQKEIKERLKVVEDSITEVAKRQVEIKAVVTREISKINENISMTMDALESRNSSIACSRQQFSMTAMNNLALLLSEALDQMNQQMTMSMSGKGSKACKKPSSKGGNKKIKNMKDLQQKMSQQLEQVKAGLEKQKKNGKGTKGEQNALSKQIAKMAAQQEAIRSEMQKYQDELIEKGIKDGGSIGKMIKEMDEMEKDILNKNISRETQERQERIMTRMLESEKAEDLREREEKENQRKQKTKN